MKDEMLELTRQMVAIPSVNTTTGEKEIGIFIENYLRKIPYFQKHPDNIVIQKLNGDKLERRNVFALLCGEKAVNFGVYGKDAHKWTERLYMPYSFQILPELILKTLNEFLNDECSVG